MLGLITGSGFYDLPRLEDRVVIDHPTPHGPARVTRGRWRHRDDQTSEVLFLTRHGADHSVPPHAINYRANVWALRDLDVTAVIATAVSGGIAPHLTPGSLVAVDDFLNFTSGRADTFFDAPGQVRHTDMTSAYDPELRALLIEVARDENIALVDRGTYCTFNGPRFESPAEIRMAATLGADLVGMTGYPEVVLAKELDLPYASIGVVSNPAAGLGDGDLSLEHIMATIEATSAPLYALLGGAIERFGAR